MVKITTRQQFELLVQHMQLYPHIARGVRAFGKTKESNEEVWKEIGEKLNSHAPPMRTTEEWQRVWIHFKAKLKKKIAQNKSLSPLEQAVADLLQRELSVDSPDDLFSMDLIEIGQEQQDYEQREDADPEEIDYLSDLKPPQQVDKNTPEDRKFILLKEETGAEQLGEEQTGQSELLKTMQKIEKHLEKKNEILKEANDLKRKKYEVLKEIKDIKKRKFDVLMEEQMLNRKIKQTKLEILEKQLCLQ